LDLGLLELYLCEHLKSTVTTLTLVEDRGPVGQDERTLSARVEEQGVHLSERIYELAIKL